MPPKSKYGPVKARRKLSAKELANLRPAKKGEVRNPEGSRSHNPLLRAFKQVHQENFRSALNEVLVADDDQLAVLTSPSQPAIKRLIATAMRNAVKNGEYGLLERIADRLFGKVPDKLDVTAKSKTTIIDKVALATAIDELEDDV